MAGGYQMEKSKRTANLANDFEDSDTQTKKVKN